MDSTQLKVESKRLREAVRNDTAGKITTCGVTIQWDFFPSTRDYNYYVYIEDYYIHSEYNVSRAELADKMWAEVYRIINVEEAIKCLIKAQWT